VDLLEEAIIVAGRDGTIIEWNNGATRVFGWTPDEAQGMSIQSLQSAEAARGLASAVQQVFASNTQWHGETAFLRKGGESRSCEVVALPLGEERALLSMRDVTARRKKFEQVSEERHLLRSLMDGIPDIIILKDSDGRYVMINHAHRKLTGRPDDEVIGRRVTDLGLPEDLGRLYLDDDMKVLRTGEAMVNREEPFSFPDGKSGWFLTSKYPLRDTAGRILGLIVIARDITEMKRAADELTETRLRLSQHLDNSLLLVAELDPDLRITRWAGRAEKMFGWTSAEVIGRTMEELNMNHPDEAGRIAGMLQNLTSGAQEHSTLRCRNVTKDGRVTLPVVEFRAAQSRRLRPILPHARGGDHLHGRDVGKIAGLRPAAEHAHPGDWHRLRAARLRGPHPRGKRPVSRILRCRRRDRADRALLSGSRRTAPSHVGHAASHKSPRGGPPPERRDRSARCARPGHGVRV
jgi:PAS domain S-box-containing protein